MRDRFPLTLEQLLGILQYLALLFFVAGGIPLLARRRRLRAASLVAYGCALLLAVLWVVLWWLGLWAARGDL